MKYGLFAKVIKMMIQNDAKAVIDEEMPGFYTKAFKREVNREYKAIIKRTEGVGGIKKNKLEIVLILVSYPIALYHIGQGKIRPELISKIIDRVSNGKYFRKMYEGKSEFDKKTIELRRNLSINSQTSKYKNDWKSTFEYKEGIDEYFLTYTECGVCKVCKAEGCFELVRYMCGMDYPICHLKGSVLDRNKTLGYGDEICNFHVMSKKLAEERNFVKPKDAK